MTPQLRISCIARVWFLTLALMATCALAQKPVKPGLYANFKTEFGNIRVLLFEKDMPVSVATFAGLAQGTRAWKDPDGHLVKKPLYNNTIFYRVVPGAAVQGGSPTGVPAYDCGFVMMDEFLPGLQFRPGSLAIANTGEPDSGSCQFFFTSGPMPSWNRKYAIIGQAVEGLEIVEKMCNLPTHEERPLHPPKLISVTIERIGPPLPVKKHKLP